LGYLFVSQEIIRNFDNFRPRPRNRPPEGCQNGGKGGSGDCGQRGFDAGLSHCFNCGWVQGGGQGLVFSINNGWGKGGLKGWDYGAGFRTNQGRGLCPLNCQPVF
jgi:hypothetical protein